MTGKTLEQNVREWLETEGYPLEIRVARMFRSRSFSVQQSAYYKNEAGVFREIDVLAVRSAQWQDPMILTLFELQVIVECKGLPTRPWVVFSAPVDEYTRNFRRDHRIGTSRGINLLSTALMAGEVEFDLFRPRDRAGYSVVPAFKGNDDAYNAVSSVMDAAQQSAIQGDDHNREGFVDLFGLYFPIIVINAPLLECFEDEEGALQLEQCEHMPLHWRRDVREEHEFTVVDIVTERGLSTFAGQLGEVHEGLDRVYSSSHTRHERALNLPPRAQVDVDDDEASK